MGAGRAVILAGASLTALALAAPAQAECVVEGETTICTGDNSAGIPATTPNVIVTDLTSDIAPPAGFSAIWMPDVTTAEIDTGDYALIVQGAAAIAADADNAMELDFTGTIEVTGLDPSDNASSGIMANATANAGSDAVVRSVGDITIDITRDADSATWGNRGIGALGGGATASIASTGDVSMTVAGQGGFVLGLQAAGSAGASVTSSGNVSVAAEAGFGSAIGAASEASSEINSVGDITVDFGAGVGHGISANGLQNTVVSQGNITADDGGIVVRGQLLYDDEGNLLPETGPAQSADITSQGTITTGGTAILVDAETAHVVNDGLAQTSGDLGSGIHVTASGEVTIESTAVVVTGPGGDPGVRDDGSGYRIAQGGIIVEGGDGPVSIVADSVDVAGEHRYGVSVRGNGAIDISADEVTLASADSVAVVARGGMGDVSITTGTVTTTGASGSGVYADTTSGNIVIDAGVTRVENEGQVGWFAGDAVSATSGTGSISITSADSSSAGLYGTAVLAISDGDVTIDSGIAETTGDSAASIYAGSNTGALSITADQVTASGADSVGIFAYVGPGGTTIDVGSITSAGDGIGLLANEVPVGQATINVAGDIVASGRGVDIVTASSNFSPNSLWTNINVAEGASITGATGVGLTATHNNGATPPPQLLSGIVNINNDGSIVGTSGTALALAQTVGTIVNRGIIDGDVVIGTGTIENRGGTIDGDVTLNTTPGGAISMFAYEGETTGVTGTITGSAAIDTFAQIFSADGTAVIGGGLPTAFDRYGVITDFDASDVTVIVETAANPVGATPSLLLYGNGSIVNRANLAGGVVPGTPGTAPQVVAAVTNYGFTTVDRGPFGLGFVFDGGGTGPASFTNEAQITGQVLLSTSEFVNSGTITRSSAGSPSIVTARTGEAFTFTNTGTIGMTDQGNRVRNDVPGFPFNDVNPYYLPETAMTIRSAVSGTLDEAGIYVPATITNSGTIEGGLLARMTASEFTFDNSGTIAGFNGEIRDEIGLTILLGRNYDAAAGSQDFFFPPETLATEVATITNSGDIVDGAYLHLIADVVSFENSGLIAGNDLVPDALFIEQSLENDTDATSFSFVNTGEIDGNVGLEIETTTAAVTNDGTITGAGYPADPTTFGNIMFGGQAALEIDNEASGDNALTFVNTGSVVNTAIGGSGVTIEIEAGDDEPDVGEEALVGNATVAVVNSGTISATGGATIVPQQFATWLEPGQFIGNPTAALAVDATDVNGDSVVTIENQAGGLIQADGPIHAATPGGYFPIEVEQAGVLSVAVYATGKTINIVNAGDIVGGPGTVHNPNAQLEYDLYDDYLAGAIQTAGDEYEVGPNGEEVYIASVDHVTNTATGTIVGSIDLGGGDDRLVNAGSITGDVFLRDGDDVLELSETSIIDGVVDLGDGDDAVVLAFSEGVTTGTGALATTVNAEGLFVQSGNWRAEGPQSEYALVEIAEGSTLTVVENDDGELAVATGAVALEGALRLDLSVDETEGDLGETTIAGAGSLHLVGTATVELTDATGLQHTGGTFVENGELLLNAVYGGDITTLADGVFELGAAGDFTGNLVNDGTFVFVRDSDYDFLGDFSGSGLLQKDGAGTLTFAGLYAFEGTTTVLGGAVSFTGQLAEDTELDLQEGTVDLSNVEGGEQTIGQLSGEGGELQLGETQLVIKQNGNTQFTGSITGTGNLIKEGEGDLKLNGDGAGFTGTGQVGGGTLSVNGNYSNANFVVNSGGKLGGAGTVGNTSVDGGTLAPGNSIDTLTVNGNIAFTAASVYEVEVNAAGDSDLLQATGTATLGGAAVDVIAESGVYRPLTDYTILTADGGVSGTFSSVETNLAFLDPSLIYSANAVTLRLVRNDIDFSAMGGTPNQVAIGNLIESLGFGNALYDETLSLVIDDVAVSFASLTGEVYPAYGGALIETAEMLRRQTAGSMAGEGAYAWASGLYNNVDSGDRAGGIELIGKGVAGGFGFGGNGFSVSAGLGKLDHDRGGADFADGDVTFAIAQLAYNGMAGLSVSAGAQFGWADGEIRRQTTLGTIGGTVSSNVDSDYLQLFGEIAYSLPVGGFAVEPFVGVSHVSLEVDGVTETGAATALAVGGIDREVTFGDIGLRLTGTEGPVRPFASAAYRHAWGDRASAATVGFAGAGGTTLIGALPIAQDAAELSAGVTVTSGAVELEVGYDGTISNSFDSHGLNAGVRVRF